jgi:cell division septation protein DedD
MREDIRKKDIEPPLISAPEHPVKRRPDQPGGLDIPNRNRAVFDLLAEPAREREKTSAIIEGEKPAVTVSAVPTSTPVKEDIPPTAVGNGPAQKIEKKEPPQVRQEVQPQPEKNQIKTGVWGVQLASFVNRADAMRAQASYEKSYASLLEELSPAIQNVTLNEGRGERYRVQFFGLSSKQAALGLCRQLKKQNQGCLHVKR